MRRIPSQLALVATAFACMLALVACGSSAPVLQYVTITPVSGVAQALVGSGSCGGDTVNFTASAYYSDGSIKDGTSLVTWGSSNTAVATISAGGAAAAVGPGTTTITASAAGTPGATSNLTVTAASTANLTISPGSTSIPIGTTASPTTQQYKLAGAFGEDLTTTATWASSKTAVATIGANTGLATAVSQGTTKISATVYCVTVPPAATPNVLTVTAATPSITTSSLSPAIVNTAYSATVQATGGLLPYTWSVTTGTLPAGLTLNASTGVISGTPTATGTSNFTVQVADSESPANTATANLSITVNGASACGSGSESLLNGSYAFVLKGFDNSGNPVLIGGVLTFSGLSSGLITAGTIDENLAVGPSLNLAVVSGSTYSVGSDQRGCMTIVTSAGTMHFRFSVGNIAAGVAATVHVINFDTTGPFVTGIMRQQSGGPFSNASANGSFAFGGSSIQNMLVCNSGTGTSICGGKFGLAGQLVFNGTGGLSGSEDVNQNGFLDGTGTTWPSPSPINFNSATSTYSILSNGRGTLTLTFVGSASTAHAVIFLVSSTEAFFMSSDAQTTTTIVAGQALLQSGAPFSGPSLSGNYVGYSSALGNTAGTTTAVDLLQVSISNPNITGTISENNAGTFTSGSVAAGATYTVTSAGRVIATGGNHPPLLYIVNSNQAFYLGSNGRVDTGFFESQTATSASGIFATGRINPEGSGVGDQSGVVTLTSGSATSTDDSNNSGMLSPNHSNGPFTYSIDSTGLGHVPSGCTISATSTTCESIFIVISSTKLIVTNVASTITNPAIQGADQ